MSDKKISALPIASTLTGSESVPIVQTGNTVKTTVDSIIQYVSDTVKPYKVYTALVYQYVDGNGTAYINSDDEPPVLLTIGVTYTIVDNAGGLDMTNVGAPNNENGTSFVATGTTPANWGNGYVSYETGAPIVTVLENTIGNLWWSYVQGGDYFCNSDGKFTAGKTFALIGTAGFTDGSGFGGGVNIMLTNAPNEIEVTANNGDGYLINTPIEIRVYN